MTIRLDHTIALVTGAAGGIGRAVCAALNDAGAIVLASDLAPQATVPGAVDYRQHDVSSAADWAGIAAEIRRRYGRLDALVNAAAICQVSSIEETTLEEWRRVQSVNVESMLIGTQAMLPLLKESGGPPLSYRMTMGVRPTDQNWRRELNGLIRTNQAEITKILVGYGVPLLDEGGHIITGEPPAAKP